MKQKGLFDEEDRLRRLTVLGDPLEKVAGHIEWEAFQPTLSKAFKKERKKEGRPAFAYLLMFKILILQAWYNIADDRMEFQINDRLSFQRFLGLTLRDKVPDAKTIWAFREHLSKKGTRNYIPLEKLFRMYEKQLEEAGLITRKGSAETVVSDVDATFVDAPRQRNHRAENTAIKAGKVPDAWQVDEGKLAGGTEAEKREERRKKQHLQSK
jgi:hypothetical protein